MKYLDGTSFNLDEGVQAEKFYANLKIAQMPKDVKMALLEHGYDLTIVPGAFIKKGTMDEKEFKEFNDALNKIDALGLKDIFNANLSPNIFKTSFVARVEHCVANGIPYVDKETNAFLKELNNTEDFGFYTASVLPLKEVKTAQELEEKSFNNETQEPTPEMDEEDNAIKYSILKTLGEISANAEDPTLTFLVSSIISNLDSAILKDGKKYKIMGVRHLVEEALEGVALTNEMQALVENSILGAFPLESTMERGIV